MSVRALRRVAHQDLQYQRFAVFVGQSEEGSAQLSETLIVGRGERWFLLGNQFIDVDAETRQTVIVIRGAGDFD